MAGEVEAAQAAVATLGQQDPVLGSLALDYSGMVILGIIGGIAFALLMERGFITPFKDKDTSGNAKFNLGFIADLFVGAIAAVITYSLNPPMTIYEFVAIGITAGIGGKAILTGYIKGKENDTLKGRFGSMATEYRAAISREAATIRQPMNIELVEKLDQIDKKYLDMK
jgi:hypothetical protein